MVRSDVLVLIYVFFSTACCQTCYNACRQSRIQGMRSADCYKKDLTEVPRCLSSGVEILDLSGNRIREITRDDLKKYSNIKILYLTDNIITEIEEEVLRDKYELQTLDVSFNAFYNFPEATFHLPHLRKLYMSDIGNRNLVNDIESSRPITSPLEYLDLSHNKLPRLPNLGVLPSLTYYNVSRNRNVRVNASLFAGLCNLKYLVNNDFFAEFDDACECWYLEKWLLLRDVNFTSFNCEEKECRLNEFRAEDLEVYNNCRNLHEAQMIKEFTYSVLIKTGIALLIIVIVIFVVLFYVVRRRRRRNRNSAKPNVVVNRELLKT